MFLQVGALVRRQPAFAPFQDSIDVPGSEMFQGGLALGFVERNCRTTALLSNIGQTPIAADSIDPGGKRSLSLEPGQGLPNAHEYFLRHILGVRFISHHTDAKTK